MVVVCKSQSFFCWACVRELLTELCSNYYVWLLKGYLILWSYLPPTPSVPLEYFNHLILAHFLGTELLVLSVQNNNI